MQSTHMGASVTMVQNKNNNTLTRNQKTAFIIWLYFKLQQNEWMEELLDSFIMKGLY